MPKARILLSPSGREISLVELLSTLLSDGFTKKIPSVSAVAGGTANTEDPTAFKTTQPGQTVGVFFRFDVDERAPGAPGDAIAIIPLLDGSGFGALYATPVAALSKSQSYQFFALLTVPGAGTHKLGFLVDATVAGGQVDLTGDFGPGHDPSVIVFGADP